jgi:inward rectifier potassium channel
MASRSRKKTKEDRTYEVRVVGAKRVYGDWYHVFLRATWSALIAFIAAAYLVINFLFALLYVAVGGIANARHGSLADAFNFSVQTMGTIGYGAMYPASPGANNLVVAESVVSLVVTALATGLVFAKFARPIGRVAFSRYAVIAPMDGVPTLMVRVGNERGNTIVEAQARVALMRTTRTLEGHVFYKLFDLILVRDRSQAVTRSWTVQHRIDEGSPLFGATPESLAGEDAEILITLAGTDDTSYQPVHARKTYEQHEVLWGARHADVLSETPDGNMLLDVRRFNEVEATLPTAAFPYPRATGASSPPDARKA